MFHRALEERQLILLGSVTGPVGAPGPFPLCYIAGLFLLVRLPLELWLASVLFWSACLLRGMELTW